MHVYSTFTKALQQDFNDRRVIRCLFIYTTNKLITNLQQIFAADLS